MPADPPVAIPDYVSHELHGHWVRHRRTGHVGRIGYHHKDRLWATVIWDGGAVPRPWRTGDTYTTASTFAMEELETLDRQPEPWYDFAAIARLQIHREA